jgi:hypothetical protein
MREEEGDRQAKLSKRKGMQTSTRAYTLPNTNTHVNVARVCLYVSAFFSRAPFAHCFHGFEPSTKVDDLKRTSTAAYATLATTHLMITWHYACMPPFISYLHVAV